jgi:hypothetical protein
MAGLKLLSGRRIFLHPFLAWILIAVICLYNLIIIECNHGGNPTVSSHIVDRVQALLYAVDFELLLYYCIVPL